MELENIKKQTTWNDAAERINRNNIKINTELTKLQNATYKSKGYFKMLSDLQTAYPTASAGSKAYVGTNYPYDIYIWDAGRWVYAGEKGGDENVNLGDFYTKEETHAAIKDEYEVLTQDAYDSLESKEEKLYFCTED